MQVLHSNGDEWFSGDHTEVIDITSEGLPLHGGAGSRALKANWLASECQNENLVRVGRLCRPPAPIESIEVGEGDELWIRIRLFIPEGFPLGVPQEPTVCSPYHEGGGGGVKFLRPHWSAGSPYEPQWGLDESGLQVFSKNDAWNRANVPGRDDCSPAPPRGEWFTLEMYQRYSLADHGAGDLKVWFNNERTFTSAGGAPIRLEYPGPLSRVEIFEYWNGGIPTDGTLYIDDLVMTTSPQNIDAEGFPFVGGAL